LALFIPEDNKSRMNMVTVKSNSGSTITFTVTPTKTGYIPIKITARCELAGDTIEQLLLVVFEGTPVYVNKAVLLDLRTDNTKTETITIETPEVALPESTSAEVSIFGDFLGTSIENVDSLVRVPGGCGEQNMASFAINLVLADYLKSVQQLTTVYLTKFVKNLELGYQIQLGFQLSDGSFVCSSYQQIGSTWLTAFVVRYFAEAKSYIKIDDNVLSRAMDWLVTKQSENGRFIEAGQVVIQELKSETSEGVGLTAHVLMALMAHNPANKNDDAFKKATDYIINRLKTVDHLYSLALSAYALQIQGHSSASEFLIKLNKRAIEKDGLKWWEQYPNQNQNNWWYISLTKDIEVTSIALTTYAEVGLNAESMPILQWLIKKRNSRGGMFSTQDTLLSIQALAKIASNLYAKETSIDVAITYDPNGLFNVKVTRDNAIALQSYVLPADTKSIKLDCKGTGLVVGQVAYKYYVPVPEPAPRFNLDIKIRDSPTAKNLQVTICNTFIADKIASASGMAIVEVTFPSGYTFNRDSQNKLRSTNSVTVSSKAVLKLNIVKHLHLAASGDQRYGHCFDSLL
jgi:CD109 antigen